MHTFETTDIRAARRCRFAQFTGQQKTLTLSGLTITGTVHSVMEDASCAPKKWIIKIAAGR